MFNLPPPPGFRGLDPSRPLTVYYRNLPHWRQEGATYFVTFRLADALPQEKLLQLRSLRRQWEANHPPPHNDADWRAYARDVTRHAERWLDEGHGACVFRDPDWADILANALLRFNGRRYFTSCFAILPNHCHVVMQPFVGYALEGILQGCKGYVAHEVNRRRGQRGTLWQDESYDQAVRDEEHLWRVLQYIGRNPGRAGIPRQRWYRWVDPGWRSLGWDFVEE
jgi:hypothetical protein